MNALASPEVGKFVNENFCSSFQKVATFKIVGGAKQGGNVATYFCAPDGRVLHVVAGPVDAPTFLKEAKWVVDTTRAAMKESKGDGGKFKAYFRTAHATKLRDETGLAVTPTTFDPPEVQDEKDALTYRDPSGQPLAPKLPPPPIDGPDVSLEKAEFDRRQVNAANAPGAGYCKVGRGGRAAINNQGRVSQIMAGHAMVKIEKVYGTVFENILGEKISTKPVETDRPFSWVEKNGDRRTR
ncbi:MAG TPA: hypothetical protein VM597_13545 [Gemmataceae bacterium]|nr:hypothetical protein [Gemmataceae bacterium]